jgi:hypothetical protein
MPIAGSGAAHEFRLVGRVQASPHTRQDDRTSATVLAQP